MRISTKKTIPFFPTRFWFLLLSLTAIPTAYGTINGGIYSGLLGALVTTLAFLGVWFYSHARDAEARRQIEESLRVKAEEASVESERLSRNSEVGRKVFEVLLADAREDLDASNGVVEDLIVKMTELGGEVAQADSKDAVIKALQTRIQNLNDEYHNKNFRRSITTSADVNRLMGRDK